jgi:hypothetical protein
MDSTERPARTQLYQAAISYAERGWSVLPLHTALGSSECSCSRVACSSIGKHPRTANGVLDATTDAAAIRRWFEHWPDANVGVATGVASGLLVLDVDPRHGGDESLAELEREHGALPHTVEAITGGGGRHLIFAHPDTATPSRVNLRPGLDVRADGSYIVVPPSRHQSGNRYEWEIAAHPDDIPAAAAPAWLPELIGDRGQRVASSAGEAEPIREGKRNLTLTRFGGAMRAVGMSAEEIEVALLRVNQRCLPPLSEFEVKTIAASVGRYKPSADAGSVTDRYGPLAQVPWVPLWVPSLHLPGIPPAEFKALAALLSHYRQADVYISLSQEMIAREIGVGRRTANKHLVSLRCKGFIAVRPDPRYGRSANDPTRKATLHYCPEPAIALITLWAAHDQESIDLRRALWQAGIERLLGFASSVKQNEWSWRAGDRSTDSGDAPEEIAAEFLLTYGPNGARVKGATE